MHYTLVTAWGTRHVSVNQDNDVWVSGYGSTNQGYFDLIDGDTGLIIRQENAVGYGGYGGLIDGNGVIWSARSLLRWDTALPLTGPNGGNWTGYDGFDSYGLCIDPEGNVWNTSLGGDEIRKFSPSGTLLGTFGHGSYYAQGCVADGNGDIWVAGSLYDSVVGHLKNDGTFVGTVSVGSGPTGVAVDTAGKIWATNYNSGTVSRIDPALGGLGADGVTPIGAVDLTTVGLGGNPYNYSDMTGSTLTGAPESGTWTVVYDSGKVGAEWGELIWNASVPGDGSLTVTVASSQDGSTYSPAEVATSEADLTVPDGRYLRVSVIFNRASADEGVGESPILYDITVCSVGDPLCFEAPSPSPSPSPSAAPAKVDVSVTKSATVSQAAVGDGITYTLVVKNTGGTTATNVTVSDAPPSGVTFLSSSATQGSCSGTNPVNCSLGSLAPGAAAGISITARADAAGTAVNRGTAAANEQDSNTANNAAEATVVIVAPFRPPAAKPAACGKVSVSVKSLAVGKRTVLRVTVRDKNGEPLRNARVVVRGAGINASARTSAKGVVRFALTPTKAGVVRIKVGKSATCAKRIGAVGAFQPPITA